MHQARLLHRSVLRVHPALTIRIKVFNFKFSNESAANFASNLVLYTTLRALMIQAFPTNSTRASARLTRT